MNILEPVSTMAKAAGPRLRVALPTLGGLALLAVAGAWTYAEFFDKAPETYGQLVVDSPEIYTRERLVNDRFVEDAWLRRRLRDSDRADFSPTGSVARRDSSAMRLAWNAETTEGAAEPPAPRDIARRDAQAMFRSELTYRGDIRNLIIENQLDDRHDLRGNSLFRLKFDASVLPGDNTRANALISVTLEEPAHQPLAEKDLFFTAFAPAELKRWRVLFDEWLHDINENINQIVTDLKYDYETYRFTRENFNDLIIAMQQCEDYDADYYEENLRSLVDTQDDVDPRAIKTEIELMRKKLSKCDAPTAGADGIGGALVALKGARPPEETVVAASTQDDDGSAIAADGATRVATRVRRKVKSGESRKDKVSLNEMINRVAAPRLFQLIFGRGTRGANSSGSTQVWDFFEPYADLTAKYRDENAFRLTPKTTRMRATRAQGSSCGPEGAQTTLVAWEADSFLPWQGSGFCLAFEGTTMEAFLAAMSITANDLEQVLKADPAYAGRLEAMISDRGEPVTIEVESGLFSFIRKLQRSTSVFSYAVTPKQAVQSLVVDDQASRQGNVAAGAQGIGGSLSGERGFGYSGVREQPLVVGFGNALGGNNSGAQIEFGWFISPAVQGADGAGLHKAHAAAQYALTALVSVPAWWDKIDLEVERAWLDQNGRKHPVTWPDESGVTEDAAVTIDLPRDLEGISASLFNRVAGPEVEEGKMETIALTVCRQAAILLPGRRLWRSAVVTLGSQTADEIHVLPNMRGIIAKFDRVQMPSGWSDFGEPYRVPVTVWTSEGSRTLRNRARINLPSVNGAAGRPAAENILYANGTCRPGPREGAGDQQASAD